MERKGRKYAAQTPAPKSDRIYGSKTNKAGSAASKESAKSIELSDKIVNTLKDKAEKYNETHKNDVSVNTLKAVFRRGSGAYSKSHRPTITGGAPNSRNAWSFARVNKFLDKKSGNKVKAAYVQDDDLLANGGVLGQEIVCHNCGWEWNTKDSDESDKYVCHKCGFDNTLFYTNDIMAEGGLIAPNGKPTNLTPEQYVLVRTPEFKAWFGDWENDPQNASKVVDENGEPLVVYHGSNKKFNVFKNSEDGSFGKGIYFDADKNIANGYTDKYDTNSTIYNVFLNIKKPYIFFEKIDGLGNPTFYEKFLKDEDLRWSSKSDFYATKNLLENYDGAFYSRFEKLPEKYKKTNLPKLEYVVYFANQIKLADGTNTTFDMNNPDIRYKKGGNIKNNNMELTPSLTISDIDNKYPDVSHDFINKQVHDGIKTEMEHTADPEVAKKIALDHLNESIYYYEELEKMEKRLEMRDVDEHYEQIKGVYAEGGEIDEIFHFDTPTKAKSRLTYIQQVLVRTSAFKNWFGDWEKAAKRFLADNKENYEKHYQDISKVIDSVTLEPRVVYHGTMTDKEFFAFDVTRKEGLGRPYAYFAFNKEYAQHFTTVSQREGDNAKPLLYEVFLNVKHPFIAQGSEYVDKDKDAEGWLRTITGTIVWDRYKSIDRDDIAKAVESTIENQVGRYVKSVYPQDTKNKFWKLMAADGNKQFKFFLLAYDFDGVFYSEEFARDYDLENPAQFTLAITVFDAHQIKLADGRNTQFSPFSDDIRFEKGGETIEEHIEKPVNMNKLESLQQMMEKGGKVKGDSKLSNDAKDGGYFVGKSHAEGGIKVKNVDTNQIMEVEGNEVIINKRSVADGTKREFEGEMLTNREILSKINEGGGGVSFADGGEVKYNCGCSKKSYNFGGEILEESTIVNRMNNVADPVNESKEYLSNLMTNIYG